MTLLLCSPQKHGKKQVRGDSARILERSESLYYYVSPHRFALAVWKAAASSAATAQHNGLLSLGIEHLTHLLLCSSQRPGH